MIFLRVITPKGYSFFDSELKDIFTIGRKKSNDIVSFLSVIENEHIKFEVKNKKWYVSNLSKVPNVYLNRKLLKPNKLYRVKELDTVKVFEKTNDEFLSVEVMKNIGRGNNSPKRISIKNFSAIDITSKIDYVIGRDKSCDIVVDNPQVSKRHARIVYDGYNHYIEDLKSLAGTYVNGKKIKRTILKNYDRISIPAAGYLYVNKQLVFSKCENGIEIDIEAVSKQVWDKASHKKIFLVDNITFKIAMGEFVAIVGGSGAGKSTLLDCINGRRPYTSGKVYYDNTNFYENINAYQALIGYVPQKDILYDNLSVFNALCYTASIRMRTDLTKEEIKAIVKTAISDVKLEGKEELKISSLSGGQKKRVSIAMELLCNPKVIFLDEPTSGLSPDLDYEVMALLKELSRSGRTIVIITHAMDNINLCDKVAFLGKGGKLCYYDKAEHIKTYFNSKDYSRIFNMLTDINTSIIYQEKFKTTDYYLNLVEYYNKTYHNDDSIVVEEDILNEKQQA